LVAAISTLVFVRLASANSCAFSNWAAKLRASPSKARPEFERESRDQEPEKNGNHGGYHQQFRQRKGVEAHSCLLWQSESLG
jgi:hypothetical protein